MSVLVSWNGVKRMNTFTTIESKISDNNKININLNQIGILPPLSYPFEIEQFFPLKTQGVNSDYPVPSSFHPTTITIGPYYRAFRVLSGLLLTSGLPSGGDDYLVVNGYTYNFGSPAVAAPNGTDFGILWPGSIMRFQVLNTQNPFSSGEVRVTLYPV